MTQPIWQTNAGNLGTFPTNGTINIQVYATPVLPATLVTYKFLSGELPAGTSLSSTGTIYGTIGNVQTTTTYNFTIRATDEYMNIRDRSFSVTVQESNNPKFTSPSGVLLVTLDSVYVDYKIEYHNPDPTNAITITQTSGLLPPGLYLSSDGYINGYPKPPLSVNRSPDTITYTFGLQIHSKLGTDTATYSITVSNQQLSGLAGYRVPVILNSKPLTYPIPEGDLFYDYYVSSNQIPFTRGNEYFAFKIIGHDFEGSDVKYNFGIMPPGLTGDPDSGWVTGVPDLPVQTINKYAFTVSLTKVSNPDIVSRQEEFTIVLSNNVSEDIVWNTDSNMGVINNGDYSSFSVNATSQHQLYYYLVDGILPPNLELLLTGEIIGRVAYQPLPKQLQQGDSTTFTFSVRAMSPEFSLVQDTKQFTITVYQYYAYPTENIYCRATPDLVGRKVINSLLTNGDIIPTEYLYRPNDPNFGKATEVRYIHAYGMKPNTLSTYVEAMAKNHYRRKIVLGPLSTAIARDQNNNVMYEVVYSNIIDELSDVHDVDELYSNRNVWEQEVLPQELLWERDIILNLGPWTISATDIYTSFSFDKEFHTSLSPGYTNKLYPGSLINMRKQVTSVVGQNTDKNILPLWMRTQQGGSNTIGFTQAWVICYTLPGYSAVIKNNIEQYWDHTLNEIDFTIDRYLIDKSMTFNYNTNLAKPQWTEFPSGVPFPNPMDQYDLTVLFPRKTILPKNID